MERVILNASEMHTKDTTVIALPLTLPHAERMLRTETVTYRDRRDQAVTRPWAGSDGITGPSEWKSMYPSLQKANTMLHTGQEAFQGNCDREMASAWLDKLRKEQGIHHVLSHGRALWKYRAECCAKKRCRRWDR